jgi:ribonuclease HII
MVLAIYQMSMNSYHKHMILGVDEVGRGPWAGPLVVGAVVLGGVAIPGLTDSKKISPTKREELDISIRKVAKGIGLGWVDSAMIDEIGLSQALNLATRLAVEKIKVPYHEIIIDGTVNFLKNTQKGRYVKTLKQADLLIPCVSAASIIAKVARDKFMSEQESCYPGYGFAKNMGYGTSEHANAIEKLGVTPIHRLSFAPLNKYRSTSPTYSKKGLGESLKGASGMLIAQTRRVSALDNAKDSPKQQSGKQIGDFAEDTAASYLKSQGHKILERNWKTKYCEIDIVSKYRQTIYFNEIKYRGSPNQGGGLSAINSDKLRQMRFAAQYYVLVKNIDNTNLCLSVISLCGWPPQIESYLEVE